LVFIFLNDLEEFLKSLEGIPLVEIKEKCMSEIIMCVELFILMYADDRVLLAESTDDSQKNLNIFNIYCEAWKLFINCSKSKVVIFNKRKMKNPPVFTLSDEVIEIVDSYSYLRLVMNYNGSFVKAKSKLIDQARRALFVVIYRHIKIQPISVDLQLKLFDSLVEPILLYGSEVWRFENTCSLEKIHLQFC
jgi:septum formation topological specificity factor MinE